MTNGKAETARIGAEPGPGPSAYPEHEPANSRRLQERVADRIRTGDRLDHNQELYQLSYSHHAAFNLAGRRA